jgi:hypothetical protein
MNSQFDDELAKSLNDRKSEACCVNHLQYSPSKPNQCHGNVEQYVGTHPGCQPVRGWLVEAFEGFTYFNAHSVVRLKDGSLADITPLNRHCPFILHLGTDEEFERLRHERPRVEYPSIDFSALGYCVPVEDSSDESF